MRLITSYKVVSGKNIKEIEDKTNTEIGTGWQPMGSPVSMKQSDTGAEMYQVLVQYESKGEKKMREREEERTYKASRTSQETEEYEMETTD